MRAYLETSQIGYLNEAAASVHNRRRRVSGFVVVVRCTKCGRETRARFPKGVGACLFAFARRAMVSVSRQSEKL